MKIAQIAPLSERVPPKKYGGTERVVYSLTDELVKRGHDVTLFATGDSITSAKLVSVYPRALREARIDNSWGLNEWHLLHLGTVFSNQHVFDIIHDHTWNLGVPLANMATTPTVVTLHGMILPNNRRLYQKFRNPYYVSISKSQVKDESNIDIAATIYNGLNFTNYPFSPKHKGYLLFVGRISADKGVHYAIDVANDMNLPLIIAAKLDSVDKKYFAQYVEPRLYNDHIKWVGEVDEKERNRLMAGAICLVNPVDWKEPFGLTMIEAMACGCPVVAFNNGSVEEIIENGVGGYKVKNLEEMVYAVAKIYEIDRKKCSEYAKNNFNSKIMADKYEALYEDIILEKSHHTFPQRYL